MINMKVWRRFLSLLFIVVLFELFLIPARASMNTVSLRHVSSHVFCRALTWSHQSSCPVLLHWPRWAYRTGVYPAPLCLCSLSCRPWFFVLWGYITPDNSVQTDREHHQRVHMLSVYFNTLLLALWLTVANTCDKNSFSSCCMIH